MLHGRPSGKPVHLAVGIADAVPKLVAHRLLEPALEGREPVRLEVREDTHERLLASLALHELDLVISDTPVTTGSRVRVFHHLLGETAIALFAAPALAARLRRGYPHSLDVAPLLLPSRQATLRRALGAWFDHLGLHPRVVGEFDDSALITTFGQQGAGAFAAPTAIADRLVHQYGVRRVGTIGRVREHYYAITVERRLRHPAVAAITEAARRELFHTRRTPR